MRTSCHRRLLARAALLGLAAAIGWMAHQRSTAAPDTGPARNPADPATTSSAQAPDGIDEARRFELLRFAYSEVIDATKHQDDKIGRLFSGVAFLTAAALAVGALSGSAYLTRRFDVPPFNIPLGLVTLTAFLVGIIFSVTLLLVGLAHPLRLPGLAEPRKSGRPEKGSDVITHTSQWFFYEIGQLSLDEWQRKWRSSPANLEKQRVDSLVREVHNLGVRTTFKYERTSEAVAILSLALFSFAMSVMFVSVAALGPDQNLPAVLQPQHKIAIALVAALYCFLHIMAPIRATRQFVEETTAPDRDSRLTYRVRGERLYAGITPFLLFTILATNNKIDLHWWSAAFGGLAVASMASFFLATYQDKVTSRSRSATRRQRIFVVVATSAVVAIAYLGAVQDSYGYALLAAASAIGLLVGTSIVTPILNHRRRRRAYKKRRDIAAEDSDHPGQPEPRGVLTAEIRAGTPDMRSSSPT